MLKYLEMVCIKYWKLEKIYKKQLYPLPKDYLQKYFPNNNNE
jgi:hypothetical protein